MNRDIVELREVIQKLVPLLSGKGLTVTQRGSQAYVKTDARTRKPVSVNIPNVSDNAEPAFIAAIQGFIDHEVAHVLITDWDFYGKEGGVSEQELRQPKWRAMMNTHNIIEDVMIEREMVKIFPGSRSNLSNTRNWFLEKITSPALAETKDPREQFRYLMVPAMRALGGHEEMQEFMDKDDRWSNPYLEELLKRLPAETLKLLETATTTRETLKVAQVVNAIIMNTDDEEEDAKGSSEDKPDKKAEKGAGTGKRDHSDANDPGDSGEAGKGGSADAEKDAEKTKSGKSSSKPSGGEDTDDEPEESSGDEGGDESDEPGAGTEDEDKPEEEDAAGESENGDDDDATDEEAESDSSDEGEEQSDDEKEGASDSSGDSEDNDGSESDDDNTSSEDTETDATEGGGVGSVNGGTDEETQGGGSGVGNESSKSIFDYEGDAFEEADMSSQISKAISDEAVDAMNPKEYLVFTRELDRIQPVKLPDNMNKSWVPRMEDEVRLMTARMQKDIERLMASQSLVMRTPGHKTGRLHAPSLYRVTQGDPRVFTQRQEHTSKDTAVSLVIDNSGSMNGAKMKLAMIAGYALSSTLDRVKITHEVIGFTTGGFYGIPHSIRDAMDAESKRSKIAWDRVIPIDMPIYKTFDERITATVKARFAFMMNAQAGLAGNIDGESLEYAAERLLKRREKRKVMLVLSDGQPAGSPKSGRHLSYVVKQLDKMGIECIGIGIKDDSVKRYYPKSTVLHDAAELPSKVLGEIKRVLTEK